MNASAWWLPGLLSLAGCLSSAPPLPPTRWFDPLPAVDAAAAEVAARPAVELHVTAAGHLGRDFVVRTAPREVVFDGQHGWIDEPAQLVAAAIAARLPSHRGSAPLRVAVVAFELDVQQQPRAVVRLVVEFADRRRPVDAQALAADRSPAALAAAMADALQQAVAAVEALVRGDASR